MSVREFVKRQSDPCAPEPSELGFYGGEFLGVIALFPQAPGDGCGVEWRHITKTELLCMEEWKG